MKASETCSLTLKRNFAIGTAKCILQLPKEQAAVFNNGLVLDGTFFFTFKKEGSIARKAQQIEWDLIFRQWFFFLFARHKEVLQPHVKRTEQGVRCCLGGRRCHVRRRRRRRRKVATLSSFE